MKIAPEDAFNKFTLDFVGLWAEYAGHQIGFFLFIMERASKTSFRGLLDHAVAWPPER